MIRLVFAADEKNIIGDSDPVRNAARFPILPPALKDEMAEIYHTEDSAIFGEPSITTEPSAGVENAQIFCLTRNPDFTSPAWANATAVSDIPAFAAQFSGPDSELHVLGGLTVFKLFLPFADELTVALMDTPVPGDLEFSEWRSGDFSLVSERPWEGGKTLRYRRTPS